MSNVIEFRKRPVGLLWVPPGVNPRRMGWRLRTTSKVHEFKVPVPVSDRPVLKTEAIMMTDGRWINVFTE
jgi:hypothetical protein